MNTYRKKTVVAVAAAVLLAGGATACEGGKKDGAAAPAKSATGASATPSAQKPAQAEPASFLEQVKKGSEDITSLRYTMSGTVAGQSLSGDVAMRLKPEVAMSMKMASPQAEGGTVDLRLIGNVMYMGSEGKYLKIDLKDANPGAAAQLDALGKAGQGGENPGDRANQLSGAKDLKSLGEETVDGQKTTHLTGTVSLEQMKAAAAAGSPEAKERQEKSVKQLEDQGVRSMVMDMWIDSANHTKQVRTQGQTAKGPMDVTIKFTEYNQPVEITAPPADHVVDLAEMTKDGGGAQG
ncbi:LppX_LprAFG lipoprotein [Streptomyces sp. A1136]|uniref:LppX_LprAFG lipoprotein n=1 Tax=Streptomyces sp. A1136 TaxID=2563102 RepID=UPI001F115FF7|nr:LppX_LprAFG lipoprotein [Streptomyces sp. A1136]